MHMIQTAVADGVHELTNRLMAALETHDSVVWLVPGGSNIPLAVTVMASLPATQTAKLTLILTDERYGEAGHANSNAAQLETAGWDTKQARFIPTLLPGASFEETVRRYDKISREVLTAADVVIGQFGVGADGHIAGILPGSPAVEAKGYASGYQTDTFRRVTLTFDALRRIDTAFAFVYGDDKRAALQNLNSKPLPLAEQPSQILKELPEAYVYNDQIGSEGE